MVESGQDFIRKGISLEDWQHGGFGVYVHWPFCQSKCPYCDFNSHVSDRVEMARWASAYATEIRRVSTLTAGRLVHSIYFGGGTPSLMSPDLVGHVLGEIRRAWTLSNDCEITLEANPGSVEAGRFAGFRDAGVNRISMGLQAMNDADLRLLGRRHTAQEANDAFDIARGLFDRVSFDLIYARQNQSLGAWRAELAEALARASDHLSLYQLTIEDGTVFGERFAKGQLRGLPGEDLSVAMWDVTQEMCAAAGMPGYEISNHARSGHESSHNLIYWRGGDYAGIGPGAHGRLTFGNSRTALVSHLRPDTWLDAMERMGSGIAVGEVLSPADRAAEYLMMGLRLREGISRGRFVGLGGTENAPAMAELDDLGLINVSKEHVTTTPHGALLLNEVLRRLLV